MSRFLTWRRLLGKSGSVIQGVETSELAREAIGRGAILVEAIVKNGLDTLSGGWRDNRLYFSTYDEARNWIMEDMKTYNKENAIPEYAIDHETTQTIEFVLPRKKKCDGVLFGANRAPDDEYKGVTEVWVQ